MAKNSTEKIMLSFLKKKKKNNSEALKGSEKVRMALRQEVSMKVTRQDQTVMVTPCSSVRS